MEKRESEIGRKITKKNRVKCINQGIKKEKQMIEDEKEETITDGEEEITNGRKGEEEKEEQFFIKIQGKATKKKI